MNDMIEIYGAKENNLKNISLMIPKQKLVVLTGPSGSGKSTLAMDILQRECQRQYMESMGMPTEGMSKPNVERIIGLSPSIGVGQHITNRNPRSTVGTVTDMYTYLRLIYEKIGERQCPNCHEIIPPTINPGETSEETGYKEFIYCPSCNERLEKLTRSHFSFNTIEGACGCCGGLGKVVEIKLDALFQEDLSMKEGGVLHAHWQGTYGEYNKNIFKEATKHFGIPFDDNLPLKDYSTILRDLLLYGVEDEKFIKHFPNVKPPKTVGKGKFVGILPSMWRRYKEGSTTDADYFYSETCPECAGYKLKKESREVFVRGRSITEVSSDSLDKIYEWLKELESEISEESKNFIETFLTDLITKVSRIIDVGLGYLSIDRQTITLSGGEAQRLRLASILGSGLTGVLYILDEPTAGLHPKDTKGLVQIMKQLRDLGNTVLVIEHDVEVMHEADYIIDIGPGAGSLGGQVVGEGSLLSLIEQENSVTGSFLREQENSIFQRREGTGEKITIHNAYQHNLKNVTASLPLGCLISVSGVSGSGKSSLVFDVLNSYENGRFEGCDNITGMDCVSRVISVDQSPLSRMQRSNVATYTDVFTLIRNLYASLPEAKTIGLKPKDFSFNTPGGRCENCQGLGFVTINMHFLPDLEVQCPTCRGKRFTEEILTVKYNGYSISDILDISVEESLEIFDGKNKIAPMIRLLIEIGLGYLKWGQSLTTLSGGEGQRLKLSKELTKQTKDHTLYILDEPSTGLHPRDIKQLLLLLNRLVDAENTVIVVEHNSDIIRESDWVIDLGPEGGSAGGKIIAHGTPEQIAAERNSYTGLYLNLKN